LIGLARGLAEALAGCRFGPPADRVYRPLDYAWAPHREYLERFGAGRHRVLFLGMNPGPWGMAQTGVPFGEVAAVRDWMKIGGEISRPADEHPKRPVEGFACKRSEVSGRRLWGLFAERFGTPERFFRDHYVSNYCPLVWMKESGANLTPDKLPAGEMAEVERACREHLDGVIECLEPEFLVGIGVYAETKLREAAERCGGRFRLGRVLHPSPASPAANRGWAPAATRQLEELGVW
jgi:single-strand selective monofunctional uracil DNA glycosylase